MQESTTVRAETVEKAVKIALTKLNITQDKAEINVINEGKKGLFGFGKQDAIVEVTAKETISITEMMDQLENIEKVETTKETVSSQEVSTEKPKEKQVERFTEPIEEADIDLQGAKEEAKIVKTETKKENVKPKAKAPQKKKVEVENTVTKQDKAEQTTKSAYVNKNDEEDDSDDYMSEKGHSREEACTKVATYLTDVINQYGAKADITFEDKGYQVIFNIDTNKSGLVIGKHGKIINSLQTLAQILLHRYERKRVSVILNVGDYRNRRANVLEQIAERTAKEVLRTKQAVILDPLPSYERKQIHAYLSKIDHIATHSEGKDPNRYLVVEYVN